jgi:hypothetical protein
LTYLHFILGDSCSLTKTDDERRSKSSTSQTSLLTTTTDDRVESDTGSSADVASTNALGTIKLVTGDRHEVNVELVDVEGNLAHSLSAIGVEKDLLGSAQLADFLQRLDNTNLVVDSHD